MTTIVSVSMPREVYEECKRLKWGWHHVFMVGYQHKKRSETPLKEFEVEKLVKANQFLQQEIQELNGKIRILQAQMGGY